jgi:hypothetical protein
MRRRNGTMLLMRLLRPAQLGRLFWHVSRELEIGQSLEKLTETFGNGKMPHSIAVFAETCPRDPRLSRFLRTLFQFSERATGEAAKFGRGGVEFLCVVGAPGLERGEPTAEAGKLNQI